MLLKEDTVKVTVVVVVIWTVVIQVSARLTAGVSD